MESVLKPTEVYFVRHGETDWNATQRWQGHAVTPLNASGLRQAELAAARLAGAGLSALYTSDSPRAYQTAQAIAAATGLSPVADTRLREMDLGDWQGLTREEILTVDAARYTARHADVFNVPVPGGESCRDLAKRVREVFDEITQRHTGARIAVVTHGGVVRIMLYILDHHPLEEALRAKVGNTAIMVVRGTAGAWEVVASGDTAHLDGSDGARAGEEAG
ncbi:MAG: histidine phosphatase family protein [Anaerolineae bacterium]|nr:histidine phosphatase family protein [Anaerolineae bacterium]